VFSQAWIGLESQRIQTLRSLRIVQVGSRLEKNSQLGSNNVGHLESQAISSNTSGCQISTGQAYSDSKRALLLYTAHMSAIHAGQFLNIKCEQLLVACSLFVVEPIIVSGVIPLVACARIHRDPYHSV
jgi:hypothetical protein